MGIEQSVVARPTHEVEGLGSDCLDSGMNMFGCMFIHCCC